MNNRRLKFVLVGNSNVGKTAMLLRLAEGQFYPTTSTIGVEFKRRIEVIDQNEWIVEVWDTTGQPRYR